MLCSENIETPPMLTQTHDGVDVSTREQDFSQLVRRNRQRAYWMAFDILHNQAEAEDVSQDAFLKAYEKWDTFREESSRDTWFFRILVNLCFSLRRRSQTWKRIVGWLRKDVDDGSWMKKSSFIQDTEHEMIEKTQVHAIRACLSSLPEGQRTAFALRYFHDLSIPEIAEITERAQGTIKSHLFRAMKAVRKELKSSEDKGE